MIRVNITNIYIMLYKKYDYNSFRENALSVIRSINNDEVRIYQFHLAGYSDSSEETERYLKIKHSAEKILTENNQSSQIASLEHIVSSITDRGQVALCFCDLGIFSSEREMGNYRIK